MHGELYGQSIPERSLVAIYTKITLKTQPCLKGELGLTGNSLDEAKFYPIQPDQANDVARIVGNWHCLDNEDFDLYGGYNSGAAQTIRINVMLCDPSETECDEVDYPKFLSDKFVTVLTNERGFEQNAPSGQQVRNEAKLTWIPIQTDQANEQFFSIKRSRLHQDQSIFGKAGDDQSMVGVSWRGITVRSLGGKRW